MFRVLLASIKLLALCPCPYCFVKKDQIEEMRMKLDTWRCKDEHVNNNTRREKVEKT